MSGKQEVKVTVASGDEPLPLEVMEKAIVEISKFGAKINASKLNRRAIQLLVKDVTGVSFGDIDKVLDALPKLEKLFCTKG